jgi:hypothetical protein
MTGKERTFQEGSGSPVEMEETVTVETVGHDATVVVIVEAGG